MGHGAECAGMLHGPTCNMTWVQALPGDYMKLQWQHRCCLAPACQSACRSCSATPATDPSGWRPSLQQQSLHCHEGLSQHKMQQCHHEDAAKDFKQRFAQQSWARLQSLHNMKSQTANADRHGISRTHRAASCILPSQVRETGSGISHAGTTTDCLVDQLHE